MDLLHIQKNILLALLFQLQV